MKAIKLITRICNINNFKADCNHTYNFALPKSHTSYVTVPSKRLSLALKPWQTFSSLLIDVLSMILFLETQWFLLIMMHLILRSSSCSCVGAGLPCRPISNAVQFVRSDTLTYGCNSNAVQFVRSDTLTYGYNFSILLP